MGKIVGMGAAPKKAADTESAVKKENTAPKKVNTELTAQAETLTAKVAAAASGVGAEK
ncbi:MAG: hypothetical protein PHD67_09050 [Oscillospiraceae bacterium]|nr:hypothetical protein [Oscillospiraceae bacterium]